MRFMQPFVRNKASVSASLCKAIVRGTESLIGIRALDLSKKAAVKSD